MGYNRSGTRRTARLRRRKQLEERLAQKLSGGKPEASTQKAKEAGK